MLSFNRFFYLNKMEAPDLVLKQLQILCRLLKTNIFKPINHTA
jgi:hypothetical protein